MKYSDDIDLLYILEQHGWSTCYISVDGALYSMGPTHIFENPIEILLNNLTYILEGGDEVKFKWNDEPGEYNWTIKRNSAEKHKISIHIDNCFLIGEGSGFQPLNLEVKVRIFCICILKQMEKIRDLLTEWKSILIAHGQQKPSSIWDVRPGTTVDTVKLNLPLKRLLGNMQIKNM